MGIDPRTPVVVGAGLVVCRPEPGDQDATSLVARPDPVDLLGRAVLSAAADSSGTTSEERESAGRGVLEGAPSLRVISPSSWTYENPGAVIADRLGIVPSETTVTAIGGHGPLFLLHRTALDIGRGTIDVAVLVGGESAYTRMAARHHPDRPTLRWAQAGPGPPPVVVGSARRFTTEAEKACGLGAAVPALALFENAVRAAAHRSLFDHRGEITALWSKLTEVASRQPTAWHRTPSTAEELAAVGEGNPWVSYPYSGLLTPEVAVDQAAAVIVCSVERATQLGLPSDQWVFPLAGVDAADHWFLSHRADFSSSPATEIGAAAATALAGTGPDDLDLLDLDASLPATFQIAAGAIGADTADRSRCLTVTGCQSAAGSPGDAAALRGLASMVGALRERPGSLGMVTAIGGYLTAHAFCVLGTAPPGDAGNGNGGAPSATGDPALPDGTVTEVAAGFRWADPRQAIAARPQRASDAEADGEITVETYTVTYDDDGAPERAVVACQTPVGHRTWGNVTDPDQLALLVTEEGCGRLGRLRHGLVDLG
ncbi:MAG: hypothetical protein M0Z93_05925 [Actinomycetota bacterium]|nr:hypothetical protein [Actinomycetota bacterium]